MNSDTGKSFGITFFLKQLLNFLFVNFEIPKLSFGRKQQKSLTWYLEKEKIYLVWKLGGQDGTLKTKAFRRSLAIYF
jgi:hypothetical protein